ncbi:hypothetical protein [Marinibacterium profundimaris]|uniref:hypothetical protein n=1 Tax=Marinibacterium profundimaris TaxID=1679460 RepID=UPI0011811928|nr:hypothetical protein [Marinibacterium profundimaris]
MEIVPSTFLALAAIATLFAIGPYRGLWAFIGLAPFGAAAALNLPAVGGATIGQLELTLCFVLLIAAASPGGPDRLVGTLRPGQPGFWLLLVILYGVLSAAFLPRVFAGATDIFGLSRDVNADRIISIPLGPSNGNITQTFYMVLSAACFLAVATLFRVRPDEKAVLTAMVVCTSVNFGLGMIDVISSFVGLPELLDPIRTANYAMATQHTMAGIKRMVGGFPEASAFGAFTVVLFGFWLHYWVIAPRSRLVTAMFAMTAFCVLRSTSSGAYVALIGLLGVYSIWLVWVASRGRFSRRVASVLVWMILGTWLLGVGVVTAYNLVPGVTEFLDDTLLNKLESDSGVERMSWNIQAWKNFVETWTMGAGLGSVRASNWLMACLGSLGILGTAAYLAFLGSMFRAPAQTGVETRDHVIQALKVACLAQVIAAMPTAPTPNLGTSFFIFAGLIVGLSRSAAAARDLPMPMPVARRPGHQRRPSSAIAARRS